MNNLKDIKAKAAHDIWAYWMKYFFTQGSLNQDGSFTIPVEKVERWTRQMNTDFENLPESEQKSDYSIADKFLNFDNYE